MFLTLALPGYHAPLVLVCGKLLYEVGYSFPGVLFPGPQKRGKSLRNVFVPGNAEQDEFALLARFPRGPTLWAARA
jgi:hypothetical protein